MSEPITIVSTVSDEIPLILGDTSAILDIEPPVILTAPVSCKAKVPKPSASLAAGAVIAPVPPLLTGIVEAPHTPELIVPTVSILEVPAQVLNVVFSTLSIPQRALTAAVVEPPVPPLDTEIISPPHTPELIVPTVSILEVPAQVLNVVFSTLSIPQRALTAAVVEPPVPPDARARGVAKELIVPLVIKILSASILD